MRSFIAALRSLVLPFGTTTGTRIVLDGVNGRIEVYNALNFRIGLIDNTGVWQFNADGSYVQLANSSSGFGALINLFPGTVVGLTYAAGNIYATTFPGQDNVPVTAISSPFIQAPFVGDIARIYILGTDDALNPPMIDLRATGPVRVLDGDFYCANNMTIDGTINGGYVLIDRLHIFAVGAGNFVKAAYPLAKRITVSIVGGGGGGGGAGATAAGQWSFGDGGGGGEYAQVTWDLSLLGALTPYNVGAAGAGGVGAAAGTNGGQSSFHTTTANGGGGGAIRPAGALVGNYSQNTNLRAGGTGGVGGHIHIDGGAGGSGNGFGPAAGQVRGGDGGISQFSGAAVGQVNNNGSNAGAGAGGGGAGASRPAASGAANGGNGSAGAILIDVYA